MPTELALQAFDYDAVGIATADAKALERHADKIERIQATLRKSTVESTMAMGEELAIARHRLANNKNGTFRKWAKERCGFSNSTITNILTAYDAFKEESYLPTVGKYIDVGALYLLASDKLADDVVDGFIERASAGETVTQKEVKAAMPKPEPKPKKDDSGGAPVRDTPDLTDGSDAAVFSDPPEPTPSDRYRERLIAWTRTQLDNIDDLSWTHAMGVWAALSEMRISELESM